MGTISKQKKIKRFRQKLELFRANEPSISVLMWGINYSCSAVSHVKPRATLLKDDYKARMKVKVNNLHFNKENMPSHFKFKEYCPMVFKNLRARFGVDSGDYLTAFNKHQPVWDSTRGKSGSKILVTYNRQFVAKTVSGEEVEQLNQILEEYYAYVAQCNGRTLLPQFLGLYRISVNDQETYILVMRNIFSPRLTIHKQCNLRGSAVDRENNEKDKTKSLSPQKNNDLNDVCKVYLGDSVKSKFMSILESDIQFLQENNLVDYSLAIGLHEVSHLRQTPGDYPGGGPQPTAEAEPTASPYVAQTTQGEEERLGTSAGDGLGSIASQPMLHRLSLNRTQSPLPDQGDDEGTDDEAVDDWDTLVGSGFALGDVSVSPSNGPPADGRSSGDNEPFPVELYPYFEYYGIKSSPGNPGIPIGSSLGVSTPPFSTDYHPKVTASPCLVFFPSGVSSLGDGL